MTRLEGARRTAIRQAAIDAGESTYYTGEPCKWGHLSHRRVDDKNCIECLKNPRGVARKGAACKRWRLRQDPKKLKAMDARINRKARLKNPEAYALYERTRRQELHAVNYDATLMKRRVRNTRRRARLANMPGSFTIDDIKTLYLEQGEKCAGFWCGRSIATYFEIDHNVPVSQVGSTNWPSNLVLLCLPCNRQKWARSMQEWFLLIGGYKCQRSM